jgi:colanic acid/amylovoran biosynthesis protein
MVLNMKLVIINQPVENRGDESAHRGLLRALVDTFPGASITCVFIGEKPASVEQMRVVSPQVEYIPIPMRRGATRIPALATQWGLRRLLAWVHPAYRHFDRLIRSATYIINAPGGICMGGFQNWGHVHCLLMAQAAGKPVAYYSRSFGPFATATRKDRLFQRISQRLLESFDFLSIRDQRTMRLAEQMGLHYVAASDTAFLDVPSVAVPADVAAAIGTPDYCVFVPNALAWHPDYRAASTDQIDRFYVDLIDVLRARYPYHKIVMLPQLYNLGERGDLKYFERLRRRSPHGGHVVALPDTYGSDIQQAIIARSKLVVGARYHSIVFAINNKVPFVALSYEHKIDGLLSLLNLEDRGIDIGGLGTDDFGYQASLTRFRGTLDRPCDLTDATARACALARTCFQSLAGRIAERGQRVR